MEVEEDNLEELMKLTNHITVYWEIFKVYKSEMKKSNKKILTVHGIEEAYRLSGRGYSRAVIAHQLSIPLKMVNKIISGMDAVRI